MKFRVCVSACLLVFLGFRAPTALGQQRVEGSGVEKQEVRQVAEFHGIEVGTALQATVTIGPKASVTVAADTNLVGLIQTEVADGVLRARFAAGTNFSTRKGCRVTIVVPKLDSIRVESAATVTATLADIPTFRLKAASAGSATITGLSADAIEMETDGASTVTLEGRGKRLQAALAGASTVRAGKLVAESVDVVVGGAATAEVNVTTSLNAKLSGGSTLRVAGEPSSRRVSTSGGSRVEYGASTKGRTRGGRPTTKK